MHIAIEGCAHGELDIIYKSINELEKIKKIKVKLLICCGDFQAVRNRGDLKCMAVPEKYMHMQDFHEYYSGKKTAQMLTIFIGGNHEASNHMQELPYGGWVAPNIYYLGYAGIVKVGPLRIGGLSGIYKGSDYLKGHFEKTPYDKSSERSVYHVRNLEAFRLKQVSGNIDIFLSHDWPRGIYHHGDKKQLIATKKHFESEINENILGSRPAEDILNKLKPKYWFSGHLHTKFAALVHHEDTEGKQRQTTKFLSLDKCLPRRDFLQILELNNKDDNDEILLQHDEEWLTILRLTNHLLSTSNRISYMPGPGYNGRYNYTPTKEEIEETKSLFGPLAILPSNFKINNEIYQSSDEHSDLRFYPLPNPKRNPQTETFCNRLGVTDPMALLCEWKPIDNVTFLESSINFNDSEMDVTLNTSCNPGHNTLFESTEEDILESHDIVFALDQSTVSSNTDLSPIKLLDITPNSSMLISSPSTSPSNGKRSCNNKIAIMQRDSIPKSPNRKIIRRNAEQYSKD